MAHYWPCQISSGNQSRRRERKGETIGGVEERMLTLGFGSIEYTVQYVSSFEIYSETDEVG